MTNSIDKNSKPSSRAQRGTHPAESASERLIEVGTRLFATRGLDGTSIRDLADAAGVNVAAVHYHFGGKEQLYAAVVEQVFARTAELRALLEQELECAKAVGTQAAVQESLGRCIHAFLSRLFRGNRPSWVGAYLQRESLQPSGAMQHVLATFVKPAWDTFLALLELMRPDLAQSEAIRFVSSSIVGQCFYYQQDLPIALATHGISELDSSFLDKAAAHITEFSLCALARYQREELDP